MVNRIVETDIYFAPFALPLFFGRNDTAITSLKILKKKSEVFVILLYFFTLFYFVGQLLI